jgi:hypothetical protein
MNENDLFNLFFLSLGFYVSLSLFKRYIILRMYRKKQEERKKAFKINKSMFGKFKEEEK